jgi:hypothetical protein
MKKVIITRVPYELSIFGGLKPLIPVGVNARQISESEHDSHLRHPPSSPKAADLETLRERIAHHGTTGGKGIFSMAPLKPDSKRITLVFDLPETVSAHLIRTLQRILNHDYEIYFASSSFKFGVFIRTSEILVWESE